MAIRTSLMCLAGVLLFGCSVTTSEEQATLTDPDDDYTSWFQGLSQADVDDFDRQEDADQAVYPSEVPEPAHDPIPTDGAGAEPVPTGTDGDSTGATTVAARVAPTGDDTRGFESAVAADTGGTGGTCPASVSFSDSVTLDAGFDLSFAPTYITTWGPVRDHNIWASGRLAGTARLTLSGSIAANANGWTVSIGVDGRADMTAWIHVFQELVSRFRRQWFAVGDGTLSGSATFADSVTFSQNCNNPGVVVTTPGTPAIGANITLDDLLFYGFVFPRLQGPVVNAVRGALAQWGRNLANRWIPAWLGQYVLGANQAYAAKKQELLGKLVAKLPPGCGCKVVKTVIPALTTTP